MNRHNCSRARCIWVLTVPIGTRVFGDLFVREFTEETEFDQFAVARRHFCQQSFQLNLALVRDQVLLGVRASEGAGIRPIPSPT